jgi:uncharacterized protein
MKIVRTDRRIIAALVSLLLAPSLLLAGPTRWSAPDDAADVLPLWEVSDGTRTLYLLGSIHLLRPTVYPLDPALYRAFDAAHVVAFEIDMQEIATAGPAMMALGMLPEGRTLRDELPADVVGELERRLGDMGLPVAVFERMKPWLVALTLSTMVLQQAGFSPESGLDMHFHARAREAGKRVVGLETLEEQLQVFDGLDPEGQAAFVRLTLAELDESVKRLDDATALWQRGAADELAAMMTESMREQPVLAERLLDARNRAWISDIEQLLAGGEPAIVIVGMGHLVGEGSVVQLLRERGYSVTRVACPSESLACAA